jgi:hypothetical protein
MEEMTTLKWKNALNERRMHAVLNGEALQETAA